MLFNSLAYLIFLPVVVTLYWIAPRALRTAILIIASYVFYMSWKPIYGFLIAGLTVVNFFFGQRIHKSTDHKKAWMVTAVTTNLLVLAYFKYTYFGLELSNQALAHFGKTLGSLPFEIILPLGISFFVFEFIHYTVDVYRGGAPIKSFFDFALFASFFPTQLAGPIKRYQDFVPQLSEVKRFKLQDFDEGMWLILVGLFKKVIFADNLAAVVQTGFSHPELLSAADAWLVAYAFMFQVYFDFSGYTDIARGSAQLMGFKVPVNFNLPYIAGSVTELWSRWHISLSTWLRDYLYIPLGGNRGSAIFTYRNLVITMVLGGLWHGAATHFVVWGLYQGMLLAIHRLYLNLTAGNKLLESIRPTKLFHAASVFLTFHATCVGWAIFRAEDMGNAMAMLRKMFIIDPAHLVLSIVNVQEPVIYLLLPVVIFVLMVTQIILGWLSGREKPLEFPVAVRAVAVASMIVALLVLAPDSSPKFVYFQF